MAAVTDLDYVDSVTIAVTSIVYVTIKLSTVTLTQQAGKAGKEGGGGGGGGGIRSETMTSVMTTAVIV